MATPRGPWDRPPPVRRRGRIVLWLTLLAGIGIAIWLLDDLFPGRLDTGTDRADLVRLVGGLLLVSAGVLEIGRAHV